MSAAEIEWLQTSWQQRWNRSPAPEELDGMIQEYIREIVLYREALALGLDKDDTVVRRRLGLKMEFLATELVAQTQPGDSDLQSYFESHRERYRQPPRYTFSQVYFDPDKRGNATLAALEAVKAQLAAGGADSNDPGALGDSLMLENDFVDTDQLEIQKLFGSDFAQALADLSPGQWHGPVPSGYGAHLVYVERVTEPPEPDFSALRERLQQDWTTDKADELKQEFYAGLRDQYTIVIEKPPERAAAAPAPVQSE